MAAHIERKVGTRVRLLLGVLCVLFGGAVAFAQEASTTLTEPMLHDLPVSSNIFSPIETTQADVTSDRFYGGGLNTGRSARIGSFLSSFTQNQFRIGDVNITAPDGSGTPFLSPAVSFWERVNVSTAFMPADFNAPGLGVTFEPRRPGSTWTRMFDASAAGPGFVADSVAGSPPSIEHLRQWLHGGVLLSGPLTKRLGVVVAGDWSKASQFERASTTAVDGESATGLINLVYTGERTELRTVGWAGHTRDVQQQTQTSFHVQTTWERREPRDFSWRVFAGYSQRSSTSAPLAPAPVFDRITDGPIPTFVDTGDHTDSRLSFGVRGTKLRGAHAVRVGFDLGAIGTQVAPGFTGSILELLDGSRARIWNYSSGLADAKRHASSISAFVADRINLGRRFSVDAGITYDGENGSATGGATEIAWQTVLPRLSMRWVVTDFKQIALFAGYRRSADRLTLDILSVGDPAAPVADVLRSTAPFGPIIARVGPGTGGNPDFSAIDPQLMRPTTDELVVGLEARPFGPVRVRFAGIAKRQQHMIDLVDTGAPLSSYQLQGVVDGRPAGDGGDVVLPVYNRLAASFGADRYLLTNPQQEAPTFTGLVFSADASTRKLVLLMGATVSQALVSAAYRGYHVVENDAASGLGELFVNPNAATSARGRPFFDRAYTLKLSAAYHFPADITLGAIARYQDGQPFSRMTIVNGLNQGAEFVRAYAAGDTRFTYTATLDARLQKGFAAGGVRVDLIVDGYNLINLGNEVEERIITGPGFRDITAIQPPRTLHAGVRLTF